MESRTQLVPENDAAGTEPHFPNKEIIGSLMYAAIATRPDIAFTIFTLTQFTHRPTMLHWEAAKCVIRYLKGTREMALTYGGSTTGIVGYSDTDHALQSH